MVFEVDADRRHCYTPSTHAMLHLHEILHDCAPLPNAAQFLAERVVGELSMTAYTGHIFEKHFVNQFLHGFALRMLTSVLRQVREDFTYIRNHIIDFDKSQNGTQCADNEMNVHDETDLMNLIIKIDVTKI